MIVIGATARAAQDVQTAVRGRPEADLAGAKQRKEVATYLV